MIRRMQEAKAEQRKRRQNLASAGSERNTSQAGRIAHRIGLACLFRKGQVVLSLAGSYNEENLHGGGRHAQRL